MLNADTLRVCDGADLIVAGSLSEHRAACVADAHRIPRVCLHYAPVRPTGAYPNMLITTRRLPRRRNLATHSLRRALHPEVLTRVQVIGERVRADTGAADRAADLIAGTLPH